jgi:hypothetical protein
MGLGPITASVKGSRSQSENNIFNFPDSNSDSSPEEFGVDKNSREFEFGKSVFESKSLSYTDTTDYFPSRKRSKKGRKIGKIYRTKNTDEDTKVSLFPIINLIEFRMHHCYQKRI